MWRSTASIRLAVTSSRSYPARCLPVDSVEQVRRQHVMFERLLGQPA
jgi:hypothetical protein